MKILVVSATKKEIIPSINKIDYLNSKDFEIDILITGIGSIFTTYLLTRKLIEKKYDLLINVGIAGSFNKNLTIGETVYVKSDRLADLGIENENEFFTIFEKGFISDNQFPFNNAVLNNPYECKLELKQVKAITVNTTHGNSKSVELFKNKFNADIETMEGAAFFYVCLNEGVKFMQLRTISNYVEERNHAKWDTSLAIKNLNKNLLEILNFY